MAEEGRIHMFYVVCSLLPIFYPFSLLLLAAAVLQKILDLLVQSLHPLVVNRYT